MTTKPKKVKRVRTVTRAMLKEALRTGFYWNMTEPEYQHIKRFVEKECLELLNAIKSGAV